ncbi:FtsX-like permease family protein [Streptomyces prunicolor]|uniref:FtsX-like permease family protein n=1 Tax=Streptomyces prunicolor TaxID=67348 RepID=UPI00341F8723
MTLPTDTTTVTASSPARSPLRTARGRGGRLRVALAVGHRAGKGSGGGLHRASLACAAFLALLTLWVSAAAHTVHAERDHRMTARNPVSVAQGDTGSAVARWWERPDTVGDRSVSVIFVRETRPGTPPPPGLDRWPKRGEAFLSPSLVAAAPGTERRYGSFAGTIGQDGLADAAELVAYVNPAQPGFFGPVVEPNSYVRGFGNPNQQLFFVSSHQFDRGIAELDLLILLMAALPCAALILVAVRSRADTRDRRLALLDALGAPTRVRALVLAGESWRAIATGVVAACAVVSALSLTSPTLPFTGYQVWSRDLRAALPGLPVLALEVFLCLVLLTVLAAIRRPRRTGTRPTRQRNRTPRWPHALFLLGLAVAAWGSEHRQVEGRFGFVAGSVVALIALPYSASHLARVLGRRLAERGGAKGDPVRIVAGRWLAARPATLARLSAALVVGLGLVTIGQVLTTQFTGPAAEARDRYQTYGAALVQVRSRDIPATAAGFTTALGPEKVLRYSPEPGVSADEEPTVRLTGPCESLRALGQMTSCPSTPKSARDVFTQLTPMGANVLRDGDLVSAPIASVCACQAPSRGDKALYGFLVLNSDGASGLDRIEQAAYQHLIGPMTALPGQSWYLGSAAQTRWLLDMALIGLAALAAAGALGAAGIFLEQARALGPLSAFRTDRRFYSGIAAWNLAIPLGIVGAVGALVAALLGGLLINLGKGGWMSLPLLLVGLVVVTLAGAVVALACGAVAARHAIAWRPQGD